MKKRIYLLSLLLLLLAALVYAADETYSTKVYMKQGGDEQVVASGGQITVESGGEIEIESGGVIDVESGGYFKLAGTAVTATATQINNATAGTFSASSKTFEATDWRLSSTEAKSMILILSSGSGTPSIVDPYSSTGAVKIIRNAGNVAITTKMSGQTGVSVASGKTAVLMMTGTDYVRVTADATH
jgi:hypothetical protein